MRRRSPLFAILALGLLPTTAPAAAGISDIANTRACWIRHPFALAKTYTDGGYPARLIKGRAATDADYDWLIPKHYDGIVSDVTVMCDIEYLAITPRFLVARLTNGQYALVNTDRPDEEPVTFATLDGLNLVLTRAGEPALTGADFKTFEDVYREYGSPVSVWKVACCCGSPVAGIGVLLTALWIARRRGAGAGRLRRQRPPGGA